MSVVVWDGKTIAADRQATNNGLRFIACKLRQLPNGTILTWTGEQASGEAVAHWFTSGADAAKWPECQRKDQWSRLIVVTRDLIVTYEQEPFPMQVLDPFMAWGSGRDYALGAMAKGADAREAVQIACRFDNGCGMGIDAVDVFDAANRLTQEDK